MAKIYQLFSKSNKGEYPVYEKAIAIQASLMTIL
jgi:hypothetical protein